MEIIYCHWHLILADLTAQYLNDEWLLRHPGQTISIYSAAELAEKAYPLAFSPKNILSSFIDSGIWPLNENIFGDEEFLCSSVTDREDPKIITAENITSPTNKHVIPTDTVYK